MDAFSFALKSEYRAEFSSPLIRRYLLLRVKYIHICEVITMGGAFPKLSYKNLMTIKHALQKYLMRDDITENDKKSEESLLSKINDEIDLMRERHKF